MAERIPGALAQQVSGQLGPWSQTTQSPTPPRESYANEVEVERREHDATLTFYRRNKSRGTLVATVIVPLALLDNILVS